jgi:SAM-dependent methyltransferase
MADLSIDLPGGLLDRFRDIVDPDAKIPRAVEALGPVDGRDVLLVDGGEHRAAQLAALGARSVIAMRDDPPRIPSADDSADVVVSFWSAFRGVERDELAEAGRILRPGGRLLVVHDYGRDDVARLRGDRPEYGAWGRRGGPFLQHGFKIRVVHAFWRFESLAEAGELLGEAFGSDGATLAAGLSRPRLSYNVAIYHRAFGSGDNPD